MGLTVQTTATTLVSTAGTAHAINMPASVGVGDLIACFVSFDGLRLEEHVSVTTGSNWRLLGIAQSSSAVSGGVYWKIAEGSDSLTLTTTVSTTSSAVTYRISGATGLAGTYSTGSSTNSSPALYSSGLAARNVLWIASRHSDSNVIASAAPTGYSSLIQIQAANTSGVSTDTAYLATALSFEDPNVFTSATEQWVCWTIAVFEDVEVVTVTEGASTFASAAPGTVAWTTPSNASALDATATVASNVEGETTQTLSVTNFGFSIPVGAVVDGIKATIYKNMETGGGPGLIIDETIKLIKAGTIVGSNYADTSTEWFKSTTTFPPSYYGRGSDLWGVNWFGSDINASTFGIAIQAREDDNDPRDARIDYVTLSVTYFNVVEFKLNFRSSTNYVTDGRGETYVVGETSSQTRNSLTFQWNTCADCARDRSTTVGSKFAGVNRRPNDGTQNTFTVTLPYAGTWNISAAFGDATNSASPVYAYFYDNTTLIDDIVGVTASPTTADLNYLDATGVTRANADWNEDEVPLTYNFASTTFKLTTGSSSNTSGETRIAHLMLVYVPSTDIDIDFATADIELEAIALDASVSSPLDIDFSVATMVLEAVAPSAELELLPSTITTASPNLNTYIRATLTMLDLSTGETSSVSLVNRELMPNFTNHFPILESASGVGLAMGQFLPENSRATLTVNNEPSSFGSQRRFSDLLQRKTIIEQPITIEVAQIPLGREDIQDSDFVEVWRAKVTNLTIRSNDLRITISRAEIPIRTMTKIVTRDNFADAPESSLGKSLPIIFSDTDGYVEVEPIRITEQFDLSSLTRVDYAYATTLADQHVVSSVVTAPHQCFLNDSEGQETEAVFVDPGSPITECDFGPTTDWFSDPWLALKEGGFLLLPGQNITEGNILVGVDFYFKSLQNASFTEQEGQGFTVRVYSRGLNGWPENILASSFNELLTSNTNIVYEGSLPDFAAVNRHRFRFKFPFNRYVVVPENGVFVTIARDVEEDSQWELVKEGTTIGDFPDFQTFQKLDPGSTDYDSTASSPDWYFSVSTQARICMEVYGLGQNDDPDGGDVGDYENGLGHARWGTRMRIQEAPDLTRINWTMRVKGLRDDSSGSITGTPNLRLTQAKHATRLILREWNGSAWVDNTFGSAKFNETHSDTITISGATRGRATTRDILESIMRNGASRLVPYASGSTASLALWTWGTTSTIDTIIDDENAELLSAEVKGVETIINHFQAAYDRRLRRRVESLSADGSLSDYYGFFDSENSLVVPGAIISASQSKWDIRPLSNINYDWIADETSIEYLAKFYLRTYNEPQQTVIIRVPYYKYPTVEVMEVVTLKMVNLPAYFGSTHDAKRPLAGTDENDVDLVVGHYWKRSQSYRAQIMSNELIFTRNQPLQRQLSLKILNKVAIT